MKVGFLQLKPRFLDTKGNTDRALKLLANVKCELMVLPELFNTGYNFSTRAQLAKVAEKIPRGHTTQKLIEFSKDKDMCIVAGIAEEKGGKFYNSAVVIDGKFLGVYRKVHLFAGEKRLFEPGNRFRVFPVRGIKLGVMICFDWYFPESARTLTLMGADIVAHPAALVLSYCPDFIRTRCYENRIFCITSDRTGSEKGLKFKGMSQITSPEGEILYRASKNREETKILDVEPKLAKDKNLTAYNNIIKDRKPAVYRLR